MMDDLLTIRFEANLKEMQFRMAQFIDVELDKMKDKFKLISKEVVSNFDFEKEIKNMFENVARQRISDMLRVECGQAVGNFLQDFDIKITIERK